METVRVLTRGEIGTLIDWAAEEGWNPGIDDVAAFQAADPHGFLGAFVDGSLAAGISVVAYGDGDGFLGLYICHPDFRSQGHGWRVWQAGMQYLGDRSIGLDGVVDQQDNYRRSGFELAYRNIRFQGSANEGAESSSSIGVPRRLQASDRDAVIELDRQVHGVDRSALLIAWFDPRITTRHSVVLYDDARLLGYATIRQCREQYKIGPLILARTELQESSHRRSAALAMIRWLLSQSGAGQFILDVPEPNETAMALATELGLEPVFETARMYRRRAPKIDLPSLFGVTTLELG